MKRPAIIAAILLAGAALHAAEQTLIPTKNADGSVSISVQVMEPLVTIYSAGKDGARLVDLVLEGKHYQGTVAEVKPKAK